MDWKIFTGVVDEISIAGPRSFSLHLFGEPLLYPRILEAIKYIKQKNPSHTVLLTTNGTLLNQLCERVIAANPDQILWSWRSEAKFTKETKEKLRKWGKFRVRFIEEVTPPEAYEEWRDWPNVEGRELHNYGGNIDLSSFGVHARVQGKSRWPCYHLWLAPAVAWNGNILLCCADPHQKEVLGTFPQQKVAEVWHGERIISIRQSHMKGQYEGICKSCDVWKQYPDLFFTWQKH